MRNEQFEALAHSHTLIAVGLGAVVATLSTFAATIFERSILRRERERDAAVMFAELLHTLKRYLDMSHDAYGRGDPFGPFTVRMLRAVRREVDIYDRNRETLFLLRDGALRLETHAAMARVTFGLERVLELTDVLAGGGDSEPARSELMEARKLSYEFLTESAAEIPGLATKLSVLAKYELAPLGPTSPTAATTPD